MKPFETLYKEDEAGRSVLYVWFSAMHTRVDLLLCNRRQKELSEIAEAIYNRIVKLEQKVNYFNPCSELSIVNRTADRHPVMISDDLFDMLRECTEYNQQTCSYFDVTIRSNPYTLGTISGIELDDERSTVCFQQPGICIDLSGFAKGYALEAIRRIVNRYSLENALVNMGNSSVLAFGNHFYGEGWKVGIDLPGLCSEPCEVVLHDQCLTISGNQVENRKHIISPYTGRLVEGMGAVVVITEKATTGEALSTALFAAPSCQYESILRNVPAMMYIL